MKRILRAVVVVLAVIAVLAVGAVAAFYYWLNEDTAKAAITRFSVEAFASQPRFEGPVTVSRGTEVVVGLPAITFIDDKTGSTVGRIAGGEVHVALWPLAIGAVQVTAAEIRSPSFHLDLPGVDGDEVFQGGFSRAHFPAGLKVANLRLVDGSADVTVGDGAAARSYALSNVSLSLGEFSPEMTTPVALNADLQLKALAPAATPAAAPQATPAAPTETAPKELPVPAAAAVTDSAAAPVPPPDVQAEEKQAQDTQTVVAQEVAKAQAEESAPHPQAEPEKPAVAVEAVDPNLPAAEKAAADAAHDVQAEIHQASAEKASEQATAPAQEEPTPTDTVQQEAVKLLPNSFAARWEQWQLQSLKGSVSLHGTLAISTSARELTVSNADASGDFVINGQSWSPVARLGAVSFKKEEVTAQGVDLSLASEKNNGIDYHLGLTSFRLTPAALTSPEMRVSYSVTSAERQSTLEAASSVQADRTTKLVKFDNLTTRYSLTGSGQPFVVQLHGWLNANMANNTAKMGISGLVGESSFTYNGDVAEKNERPLLTGELTLATMDLGAQPPAHTAQWLQAVDFVGDLRISNLALGKPFGTQLHSKLSLNNGTLDLTEGIVTVADGRMLGSAHADADGAWQAKGRIDGVDLDKLFSGVAGTASPVVGAATGSWKLAGQGLDFSTLTGSGRVRVIRGAYRGLDLAAGRLAVLGKADASAITKAQSVTSMDETSFTYTVKGDTINVPDLVARSVFLRCSAEFSVQAATGEASGKASIYYAPQSGAPSITLPATFSGPAKAVAWSFDVASAAQTLHGVTAPAPQTPAKSEEKSLWQKAKEFFSF